MRPFLLTSAARDDMVKIGRFTGEQWGKQQRNTYLKQLDTAFKLLAQQPEIGKDASAIKHLYRKFVQGSHIIFYRTGSESKILVIRVLHQSMDVDSHL
jgi:toxin ParE1/3/4